MSGAPIVVREVWMNNLDKELQLIRQCALHFRIAAFDTEFPGTVFNSPRTPNSFTPLQLYDLMKKNVNLTTIVQLGITLSDINGNFPMLNTNSQYVWQFNFNNFDPDRDLHDPKSISLLKTQGIDFLKNKKYGIDTHTFGSKFNEYGLGSRCGLTWITFHGLYDYGYLIKILTRRLLPVKYDEFRLLVQHNFGVAIHDVKPMARDLGIYGGLEKIANCLKLDRKIGKSHQAGSDSLLIMQVFLKLLKNHYTPLFTPMLPWYYY